MDWNTQPPTAAPSAAPAWCAKKIQPARDPTEYRFGREGPLAF